MRRRRAPEVLTVLAIASLVLATPAVAMGPDESEIGGPPRARPSVARKIYDATLIRPLGFIQTLVTVPWIVIAYPITLLTGATDDAIDICIRQPVDRTFRRPLGQL